METGWLPELLPRSVLPESRSKLGGHSHSHKNISASSVAPRPIRPSSQPLNRWDLPDILNPPAAPSRVPSMSLDFPPPSATQSLYSQNDMDHPFHLQDSQNNHQLP